MGNLWKLYLVYGVSNGWESNAELTVHIYWTQRNSPSAIQTEVIMQATISLRSYPCLQPSSPTHCEFKVK